MPRYSVTAMSTLGRRQRLLVLSLVWAFVVIAAFVAIRVAGSATFARAVQGTKG